ncbi:hypothetical protein E1294_46055 [Nonomuraea diastatica]|uniref:3-hydroxyisobutyrate dehydrogenase-like NAD-binding domain-containing protein n=1 Tax=Nonomuraea diastatica TaxID=1848329 RepID=A0A4R4VXK3_9ACTN|nr:hypothetical protein E1294_46055 [Nonomuraea diastatica]
MLKDMRIAVELAEAAGVPLQLGRAATELWSEAAECLPPAADRTEIVKHVADEPWPWNPATARRRRAHSGAVHHSDAMDSPARRSASRFASSAWPHTTTTWAAPRRLASSVTARSRSAPTVAQSPSSTTA